MDSLDIGDLLPSHGFLPSSSDEEDEFVPKIQKHLGNRLASIFGAPAPPPTEEDKKPKESEEQTTAPVFSCSAELIVRQDQQCIPGGKVGISVISSKDPRKYCLLVYDAQKVPRAIFLLAPDQFALQTKENSLQLRNQIHDVILTFEPSDRHYLGTLTSIHNLLCTPSELLAFLASGDSSKTCENKSTILYETYTIQYTESGLQISEKMSHKAKVGKKEDPDAAVFLGLHREDIIIQQIDQQTMKILHLKKIKIPTAKSTSEPPPESCDLPTAEVHADVKSRVARMGTMVLPMETKLISTHQEIEHEKEKDPKECPSTIDVEPTSSNTASPDETLSKPNSLEEYEAFHRIVGVEMDRLQTRLQAFFSKTLEASLAPIRDEIRSIRLQHEQMLEEISKSSKE